MQVINAFRMGAAFCLASALFAQTPSITSVTHSVTGDTRLAPGVVARVRYTPLGVSDTQHQAPNRPMVFVTVGGYTATVTAVQAEGNTGIATVFLPNSLAAGAT